MVTMEETEGVRVFLGVLSVLGGQASAGPLISEVVGASDGANEALDEVHEELDTGASAPARASDGALRHEFRAANSSIRVSRI